MKRILAGVSVIAVSMLMVSCGDDSNPSGPSGSATSKLALNANRPTPLVASSTLIPISSAAFSVSAGTVVPFTVTFPEVGTYQIAADWNSPSNDLDLYLADTNCTSESQLRSGLCFLYATDASLVKPAFVNVLVTSAPATAYLYIHDVGPFSDTGIVQLSIVR